MKHPDGIFLEECDPAVVWQSFLHEVGISSHDQTDWGVLNQKLESITHLETFFSSNSFYHDFLTYLSQNPFLSPVSSIKQNEKSSIPKDQVDMGDFQTPQALTSAICHRLAQCGHAPRLLIEPSCGLGNFVIAALNSFPSLEYVYCIELQQQYEWGFKIQLLQYALLHPYSARIKFIHGNLFSHNLGTKIREWIAKVRLISPNFQFTNVLILANPPWITNAQLSRLGSTNLPQKYNYKQLLGLDAITGHGNFDLAEAMLHYILQECFVADLSGFFVFLCKFSVVHGFLQSLPYVTYTVGDLHCLHLDASSWFHIHADACELNGTFGGLYESKSPICHYISADPYLSGILASDLNRSPLSVQFGWIGRHFIADFARYSATQHLEGNFPFVWRQGVKHDLKDIMEISLTQEPTQIPSGRNFYMNGFHEVVTLESEYVFPLLKSSDLQHSFIINAQKINRFVIIPQHSLSDSTERLAIDAPFLWRYFQDHKTGFQQRKSRIYKNRPLYAIFGIGPYAFLPWKIAISGFSKNPHFVLINNTAPTPVMTDDTCYYLSFSAYMYDTACFLWIMLNDPQVDAFFSTLIRPTAKRPFTKEVLMRLNLTALCRTITYEIIKERYEQLDPMHFQKLPSKSQYDEFQTQYSNL